MGSKDPISERRLRPVYDFLDSGNNRKAIQEADRLLKKHPDLYCAKALKALANIRVTKPEEAWHLIEDVEESKPNDDHTLQALTHCYKELARPDKIASLYEDVCKRVPKNEEFLTQLFMSYVRLRDYKKQKQTAMQMYKEFPKNPYYFWTVMSIFMQSIYDPKLAETVFLPLAQNMVLKFIEDDMIQAEAEVSLWCLILEKREKHDLLLHVYDGPLGEKFLVQNPSNRQYRLLDVLLKMSQYDRIFEYCCNTLPHNLDDWLLYTNLFRATFFLAQSSPEKKSELVDRVTHLILNCIGSSREMMRGPYLARLEWIAGLLERDLVVRTELGEPMNLLTEYFDLFGAKPCCFFDMRPYLWLLGEQQQSEFLNGISRLAGYPCRECSTDGMVDKYAQTPKEMYRHATCIQLTRCLGVHNEMDATAKLRLAKECLNRHRHGLNQDSGSDPQPSDPYLIMAVQLLWDVYVEQGDIHLLNELVLALEFGLSKSPANYQLKVILSKAYAILGVGECVLSMCESLDIKYMQKDSLGYLTFDHLSSYGLYSNMITYLYDLGSYFATSEREFLESLTSAYRNGAFGQIPDFMQYHEKSQLSIHRVGADILRRYLLVVTWCDSFKSLSGTVLLTAGPNPHQDTVEWTLLQDNRDFSVLPCWDPGDVEQQRREEAKTSYQELIDTIKLRQLIVRVLALLCMEVQESKMNVNERPVPDQSAYGHLRTLISQLKAHYRHCRATHCDPFVPSLQGPVPRIFHLFLQGGYFEVLNCLLDCASLVARRMRSNQQTDDMTQQMLKNSDHSPDRIHSLPTSEDLQGLFRRMLSSHQLSGVGGTQSPPVPINGGSRAPLFPHLQLCHVSWLLQTVSIALLICMTVQHLLPQPNTQNVSKKSKKKHKDKKLTSPPETNGASSGSDTSQNSLSVQFSQIIDVVSSASNTIGRLLDDLDVMLLDADFSSFGLTHSLLIDQVSANSEYLNDTRRSVELKMRESYRSSIEKMKSCVKHQQALGTKLKN